ATTPVEHGHRFRRAYGTRGSSTACPRLTHPARCGLRRGWLSSRQPPASALEVDDALPTTPGSLARGQATWHRALPVDDRGRALPPLQALRLAPRMSYTATCPIDG